MKYIQKELFFAFCFGWGFFKNSEGVALLLLLHVTKQESNPAPPVSAGDVGV